ncbi:MAG: hypothetical protein ACOVQJ_09090 [Bacteroidia bacterium]
MRILLAFCICAAMACNTPQKIEQKSDDVVQTDTVAAKESTSPAAEWENHGGYRIRRNAKFQQYIENKTGTRFFDASDGNAAPGTTRIQLCKDGKCTIYSNVTTNSGKGPLKEISDEGEYTVYDDGADNLYLRLLMQKSGEGFVQLLFVGNRMKLVGPGGTEVFEMAEGCGK